MKIKSFGLSVNGDWFTVSYENACQELITHEVRLANITNIRRTVYPRGKGSEIKALSGDVCLLHLTGLEVCDAVKMAAILRGQRV